MTSGFICRICNYNINSSHSFPKPIQVSLIFSVTKVGVIILNILFVSTFWQSRRVSAGERLSMVRIVLGSKSQLVLSAKTFPSDSCNWPQQLFSALHQGSAISVVDQIKTPAITARHFRYRQVLNLKRDGMGQYGISTLLRPPRKYTNIIYLTNNIRCATTLWPLPYQQFLFPLQAVVTLLWDFYWICIQPVGTCWTEWVIWHL